MGLDIEAQTIEGRTPLHEAVDHADAKTVKVLLDAGANIEAKALGGLTALYIAAQDNFSENEIVTLLLERGADIEANENVYGLTPVHAAVSAWSKRTIREFIAFGADVNAQALRTVDARQYSVNGSTPYTTIEGDTPLHVAVRILHEDVVDTLLDAGADTNIKNARGKTAFELALGNTYWLKHLSTYKRLRAASIN